MVQMVEWSYGATMQGRIDEHGITARFMVADENPYIPDMPEGSRHYNVTLHSRYGATMSTPYSMGPGLTREPSAVEVMDCLAQDAAGYENAAGDFGAWCDEYGYDTDSRRAHKTYRVCAIQARGLLRLMGGDRERYDALLFDTAPE